MPQRNLDILPDAEDDKRIITREPQLTCGMCQRITPHSYIGTQREMRDMAIGDEKKSRIQRTPVSAHRFICGCGATRVWGVS